MIPKLSPQQFKQPSTGLYIAGVEVCGASFFHTSQIFFPFDTVHFHSTVHFGTVNRSSHSSSLYRCKRYIVFLKRDLPATCIFPLVQSPFNTPQSARSYTESEPRSPLHTKKATPALSPNIIPTTFVQHPPSHTHTGASSPLTRSPPNQAETKSGEKPQRTKTRPTPKHHAALPGTSPLL